MLGETMPSLSRQQKGVVLLESLIAILIFSLGVLGIVGLQAAMITNTSDAKYRSDASYIAQQRIGRMWADPANVLTYLEADTDISVQLPGGLRTATQPNPNQFLVTVGWTLPNETPAPDNTTAPCFMMVAHCVRTAASIAGG